MHELQWVVWFALLSLVMGWLTRARDAQPAAGETALRHPRALLIVGLAGAGFFAFLALMVVKYPNKTGTPAIVAFFLGFAAIGGVLIAEYFRARFDLTPDGLRYHTLTGNRGELRWSSVRAASFSFGARWFVLETEDGRTVRVSCMLMNLPAFAQALLAQVPPERIEPQSREVFTATAAGNPPSVFQ